MLKTTRDMVMPTAITGSYPRPLWYDQNLDGRSFKAAMGDLMFREQYLDAVAAIINAQEAAGLDIVTDGDSRFDLNVGGKSWFFYPIERLGGIKGHRSTSRGWMGRHGLQPGHILWEVQEAYQPAIVADKLTRGPLEYAALVAGRAAPHRQAGQVRRDLRARHRQHAVGRALQGRQGAGARPLRHHERRVPRARRRRLPGDPGRGAAPSRHDHPPRHHRQDLEFQTEAFNRQLVGVDAEIWVHTCWGNPNQQRVYWEVPSYERALPHLLQLDCDVLTIECGSSDGKDLPLFGKYKTDKKIGIGVVNHCNTVVEPPEHVAALIRQALEYIPPERLVVTTDCGFGREGLSRRIAYYKCVSLVEGTNIVRRELGLPEAQVRAADPSLYFASVDEAVDREARRAAIGRGRLSIIRLVWVVSNSSPWPGLTRPSTPSAVDAASKDVDPGSSPGRRKFKFFRPKGSCSSGRGSRAGGGRDRRRGKVC